MPKFKTPQEAFDGSYSLSDLMTLCGLTRGEAAQWVKRGIVSARTETGKGHHREFSFFNLVEAKIAKELSGLLKISQVEEILEGFRDNVKYENHSFFMADHDIEIYYVNNKMTIRITISGPCYDSFAVATRIPVSYHAQRLLDLILENNGSEKWIKNALRVRSEIGSKPAKEMTPESWEKIKDCFKQGD